MTPLQIKTKYKQEDGEEEEVVSPTGQFLNTKTLSITILVVFEFEIPIDDSIPIKELLRDVLLPINPRFSSIMVPNINGIQHWKKVEINLEEHIKIPTIPYNLPLEAYDHHFKEYVAKISMEELPQDRPLWEVHITKYPTTKAAGHYIFKFHHAIGDGYSLMSLLLSCFRRADNPSIPLTFPSLKRSSGNDDSKNKSSVLSMVYNTVCDFGWSVFKSFVADDVTPIRSGRRSVHGVEIAVVAFSMDRIKEIKTKLGVTINDVLATIVFLGTRLYTQATALRFGTSNSTALMLLNTRNINAYMSKEEMLGCGSDTKWGNQFGFLHIPLPVLSDNRSVDPLDYLIQTRKIIDQKKNSSAVYLVGYALELLRKFRGTEAGAQFMHDTIYNTSMGLTNMIGPVQKMALANHPCKGIYFTCVGPPHSLSVTMMSYMDTMRITVAVERDFIDSQKLISCIVNAFDMIYNDVVKNAQG